MAFAANLSLGLTYQDMHASNNGDRGHSIKENGDTGHGCGSG